MANADDTAAVKISSDNFYIILVKQFIVIYKMCLYMIIAMTCLMFELLNNKNSEDFHKC